MDLLTYQADGNPESPPTLLCFDVRDIEEPPPGYLSRPPADPMDPKRVALKKSIWEAPFSFTGNCYVNLCV